MTEPKENTPVAGGHVGAGNEYELQTADIAGAGRQEHEQPKVEREAEKHPGNGGPELEPLFAGDVEGDFRTRWRDIQGSFVDEPRTAVEQADQLVAQVMQRLAQSFAEQRGNLEKQWDASEKVSTEELRVALQRYRSFFERLLAV